MNKIELLAPAGNLDMLKAAIDCGADAIYCGVNVFNARMNADNFSLEELEEGCTYAHRRSSRVYLTLNTLVSDDEMDSAVELARDVYNLGVDGILIQDIGLATRIHKDYPQIPLHASTQMNVNSVDDYTKLSEMGFSRVVVPREFSLKEINTRVKVAHRSNIEIEVFAHGAVCVCTSGLCLFSSMNKSGTRSGNRGLCAQPCRQEYSLRNADGSYEYRKGHIISPKDRSAVEFVSGLIECGVASLKIEGRMRDVNYVSTAVTAYRKLIDSYYDGILDSDIISEVNDSLLVNFNRGGSFTSQNLSGSKSENFLSGEFVGKYGLRIGFVSGTDKKKGTISIKIKNGTVIPSRGDYLSIREKNEEICSFPIGKIHEAPGSLTIKGLHPDMIAKLRSNTSVYLMNHDFVDNSTVRKTHINISVDTSSTGVITMNARVNSGIFEHVFAEVTEDIDSSFEGKSIPLTRVEEQLRKTGNTPFVVDEVYFISDNEPKCPISLVNDVRRNLMDSLVSELDYESSHTVSAMFDMFGDDINETNTDDNEHSVKTMHIFPTVAGIRGELRRDADIYAFSIYDFMIKKYRSRISDFILNSKAVLAVILPDYAHDDMKKRFEDALRHIKEELNDKFYAVIDSDLLSSNKIYEELSVKHFLSAGANLYNKESLATGLKNADAAYISYEVPTSELNSMIVDNHSGCIILHGAGPIRWMQSDFCPVGGGMNNCRTCFDESKFVIKQQEGEKDCYVIPHSADCSSYIYGDCKNEYSYDDAEEIANYGLDVIITYTEEL